MQHCKKEMLTQKQWRNVFKELEETTKNEKAVFTDGSLSANKAGSAAWCSDFTLRARLPLGTSIYTAELYAIYMALKFIETSNENYAIFTDSLSTINALGHPHVSNHHLIHTITDCIVRQTLPTK